MTLLGRARSNDQEAWNHIVHLYGPLVAKWCHRSSLNEDDTADVFQETFRALAANIHTYAPTREVGSFRSWLRSITGSKIADHFRRLKRQPTGRGGTDANLAIANAADPLSEDDEQEAAQEHAVIVHRAMELIRPEFDAQNFEAFRQVALEGRSATEVAAEMKVKPQAIRQANYRIRRRLRLILQGLVDERESSL
jgi:RNA polymerase sigma-70 factor, ECF subfamily